MGGLGMAWRQGKNGAQQLSKFAWDHFWMLSEELCIIDVMQISQQILTPSVSAEINFFNVETHTYVHGKITSHTKFLQTNVKEFWLQVEQTVIIPRTKRPS